MATFSTTATTDDCTRRAAKQSSPKAFQHHAHSLSSIQCATDEREWCDSRGLRWKNGARTKRGSFKREAGLVYAIYQFGTAIRARRTSPVNRIERTFGWQLCDTRQSLLFGIVCVFIYLSLHFIRLCFSIFFLSVSLLISDFGSH